MRKVPPPTRPDLAGWFLRRDVRRCGRCRSRLGRGLGVRGRSACRGNMPPPRAAGSRGGAPRDKAKSMPRPRAARGVWPGCRQHGAVRVRSLSSKRARPGGCQRLVECGMAFRRPRGRGCPQFAVRAKWGGLSPDTHARFARRGGGTRQLRSTPAPWASAALAQPRRAARAWARAATLASGGPARPVRDGACHWHPLDPRGAARARRCRRAGST